MDLELGRVFDGEILAEPSDGRIRIALEFDFETGTLVLENATRLDLFGEERRHGWFLVKSNKREMNDIVLIIGFICIYHWSLDDSLLRPSFVFNFGRFGGGDLASDLQLTLDFLLRLFLGGRVHFSSVDGRFKRIGWQPSAIRVDVHFGAVSFARLSGHV